MSAFGDLKYPADFTYFAYVDPKAPKGGMFSQIGPGRSSTRPFSPSIRSTASCCKGDGAQGMEHTFATLMARAYDEPDAMYGLAARAVRIPPMG